MSVSRIRAMLFAALALAGAAHAQEPINAADSATQPSPGRVILKEQFRFYRMDMKTGPRNERGAIEDFGMFTTVNVGVTRDTSLSFRIPAIYRDREFTTFDRAESDVGVGDLTALAKWRIYQSDTGPLDTARLSVIGGMDVRTGDGPFTSDAYNPVAGLAYTQIAGRHGVNASLQWTFTTDGVARPVRAGESTADLMRFDLAYLYRLAPRQYTAETRGAWYALLELNGLYETNGDNELFISPGIMYEARRWTAELSVQVPVWRGIDHRAETQYAIVAGLRFSW